MKCFFSLTVKKCHLKFYRYSVQKIKVYSLIKLKVSLIKPKLEVKIEVL